MSCGKSSCGCGNGCGCSSNCNCNHPILGLTEKISGETIIGGVAPVKMHYEGSEMSFGAQNEGCKCGAGCKCDPCTC